MSGGFHGINNRLDNLRHYLIVNVLGDDWGRGVSAHATSIWSRIAFKRTFMVLAGCHRQDVVTIYHANKAGFFPLQELLDNHTATSIAKFIVRKHIVNCFVRLLDGFGDDNAFTCSKAVGFDHNRCALLIDIGFSSSSVRKPLISCGWYFVLCHKFFCKGF